MDAARTRVDAPARHRAPSPRERRETRWPPRDPRSGGSAIATAARRAMRRMALARANERYARAGP
eukprot:2981629-Prymnesium_polylepis.1